MFYHKNCNGLVLLQNNSVIIISEFTITQRGIKPTLSEIIRVNGGIEQLPIKFVCQHCGKNVELKEIYSRCFHCGKILELNELYKVSKHSGIYCLRCSNEYIGEEYSKKPLTNLIKFQSNKGELND